MEKKIAVLPGDGIGIDVTREAVKVLEAAASLGRFRLTLESMDYGADRYLRTGETLPPQVLSGFRSYDAVFMGAFGDPRVPDMRHAADILLGTRFGLDLYANVRPVRCLSDRLCPLRDYRARDIDFVVFRENTEGLYVGMGGNFKKGTADEVALQEDVNTRKGVERIVRHAFEYALRHGRRRVTMSDKSNALRYGHDLWQRVFWEVAPEYPGIEANHLYVDALTMQMVKDPRQFDVIVTCNMFGDIVTDLGAQLQGGLGMAASGNVHPGSVSMFEPVHGSAPKYAGKDLANPFGAILTAAMMLDHLGLPESGKAIERAVVSCLEARECTADVGGTLGTAATGDAVVRRMSMKGRSLVSESPVRYTAGAGIAWLELHDPPANTYTHEMMRALDEAILRARFDPEVHVLVLRGSGDKFFCAGANIQMLADADPEFKYHFCLHANETLLRLEQTPKLVIAALNGHAVGGGLEIALAADLRVARRGGGKIGLPEVHLGVLPGTGGTQRLTRVLGKARALELMVTGRNFTFEEALDLGLVHHVFEESSFREDVERYAREFLPPSRASRAVGHIKRAVQTGGEIPLETALALERELQQRLFESRDAREGIAAYLAKRPPRFEGR